MHDPGYRFCFRASVHWEGQKYFQRACRGDGAQQGAGRLLDQAEREVGEARILRYRTCHAICSQLFRYNQSKRTLL